MKYEDEVAAIAFLRIYGNGSLREAVDQFKAMPHEERAQCVVAANARFKAAIDKDLSTLLD